MINISEFKKIYNKVNIIDIRTPMSFNNGHIDGAINIPYSMLIKNPKEYLKMTDTYYIYCQKGLTSKNVCTYLKKLGYKVFNINGGYEEWIMEN